MVSVTKNETIAEEELLHRGNLHGINIPVGLTEHWESFLQSQMHCYCPHQYSFLEVSEVFLPMYQPHPGRLNHNNKFTKPHLTFLNFLPCHCIFFTNLRFFGFAYSITKNTFIILVLCSHIRKIRIMIFQWWLFMHRFKNCGEIYSKHIW